MRPSRATARRVTVHLVPRTGTAVRGRRLKFPESPEAVARELGGLAPGTPLSAVDVLTELGTSPEGGTVHVDRLVFAEADGTRPLVTGPLPPSVAELASEEAPADGRPRLSRVASYGIVTGPDGRLLLSLIAEGFPGAGTWHLPGGGVDAGEDVREALRREVFEETGQHGAVGELIAVTAHHRTAPPGPQVHGVWVFFHVHVGEPVAARVVETGGSTSDCGWFAPEELVGLRLSTTARRGLGHLVGRPDGDR
ncbi:NUDIX hydrolase [Nocardiopsis sp. LOL_012]|uniref:NUDIX hydrolase n=1 Tax=Nocardiopsis sp. LOL_012 TaxID=3345409 RepID=UPI003A857120